MKLLWTTLLITVALLASTSVAGDVSGLYDTEKLTREEPRLKRRIKQLWTTAIEPSLSDEKRERLQSVSLEFPLVGKSRAPIDFYTYADTGRVVLPVISLLFLEDISTAYAWLHVNGYTVETIDEYVAMLKYRKPEDFLGGRFPPPLRALGIPEDALSDSEVDGLSLRFRNTAWAFILSHELGHVYYRHPGYGPGIPREQARSNEKSADLFALDIMRRTSTIPMGAVLFFQASAYWLPNRADYQSDEEWEMFLKNEATHPLNADRLRSLAKQLKRSPEDFVRREQDKAAVLESIRFIADGLSERIAPVLDDTDLQRYVASKASKATVVSLAPRRPRNRSDEP